MLEQAYWLGFMIQELRFRYEYHYLDERGLIEGDRDLDCEGVPTPAAYQLAASPGAGWRYRESGTPSSLEALGEQIQTCSECLAALQPSAVDACESVAKATAAVVRDLSHIWAGRRRVDLVLALAISAADGTPPPDGVPNAIAASELNSATWERYEAAWWELQERLPEPGRPMLTLGRDLARTLWPTAEAIDPATGKRRTQQSAHIRSNLARQVRASLETVGRHTDAFHGLPDLGLGRGDALEEVIALNRAIGLALRTLTSAYLRVREREGRSPSCEGLETFVPSPPSPPPTKVESQEASSSIPHNRLQTPGGQSMHPAAAGGPIPVRLCRTAGVYTLTVGGIAETQFNFTGVGGNHLWELLSTPGTAIPSEQLMSRLRAYQGTGRGGHQGSRADEFASAGRASDDGTTYDVETLRATKERLREVNKELDKARRDNNTPVVEGLTQEREGILAEIRRVCMPDGRPRKMSRACKKAVDAIRNALQRAITSIRQFDRPLGDHLDDRITTGATCRYEAEPAVYAWECA